MKVLLFVLALLVVGVYSYADEYCQQPAWSTTRAWRSSTTVNAIVADDISDAYTDKCITDLVFYIGETYLSPDVWANPAGVWIYFYDAECPPAASPALSFYFAWGDLAPGTGLVQSSPEVCMVRAHLPGEVTIDQEMSIGFQVDDSNIQSTHAVWVWGTPDNDVYGDCQAYLYRTFYGRWYSVQEAGWSNPADVAYCLSYTNCTVGTESTSWGTIKSLYNK